MNRRGFLSGMLLLGMAPAIVRADSLMRIIPVETVVLADLADIIWEIAPLESPFSALLVRNADYWSKTTASKKRKLAQIIVMDKKTWAVQNMSGAMPPQKT